MKVINKSNHLSNILVELHDERWLSRQRIAGNCVSDIMMILQQLVKDRTSYNLLEIDKIVEEEITKRNCTPTFKGYKGFPAAICISVNKQLVHGIPTDYVLQEGDVVSFDFGATFEGAIADSAITVIFGEPKKEEHVKLIHATRDCLYNAIKNITLNVKTGIIGNTIYKTAKHAGFNVINSYGGHGISWNKPHADLFIPNKSDVEDGVHIQPGLTIAIEPLLVPENCSVNTKVGEDNWTVYTNDISAHTEHTVFVHHDKLEIITWRPNEVDFIPHEIPFL